METADAAVDIASEAERTVTNLQQQVHALMRQLHDLEQDQRLTQMSHRIFVGFSLARISTEARKHRFTEEFSRLYGEVVDLSGQAGSHTHDEYDSLLADLANRIQAKFDQYFSIN